MFYNSLEPEKPFFTVHENSYKCKEKIQITITSRTDTIADGYLKENSAELLFDSRTIS